MTQSINNVLGAVKEESDGIIEEVTDDMESVDLTEESRKEEEAVRKIYMLG